MLWLKGAGGTNIRGDPHFGSKLIKNKAKRHANAEKPRKKRQKIKFRAVFLLSRQRGMFSISFCLRQLNKFYSSMLNSCFTVMAITPNIRWHRTFQCPFTLT